MIPVSPFIFMNNLLGHTGTHAINFDFLGISKHTGKPIVFEYLKRGENQPDYITPLTSHMNRYARQNMGKFLAFSIAQQRFDAEVYYINYAFKDTFDKDGKDIGEMVRVMKQIDIVPGRNKTINGRNQPWDIGFEDIGKFTSFQAFKEWFQSFIEDNCLPLNTTIDQIHYKTVNEEEAKQFLKEKSSEYNKDLNKSRQGAHFKKKLVMPDLGGEIFESRLGFDLKQYKLHIKEHYFVPKMSLFMHLSEIETNQDPWNYQIPVYKIQKEHNFFSRDVRLVVVFNPLSTNIKYLKIDQTGKISIEKIDVFEFKNRMKKMDQITYLTDLRAALAA